MPRLKQMTERVEVRLTGEESQRLDVQCARLGNIPRAAVLRLALRQYLYIAETKLGIEGEA